MSYLYDFEKELERYGLTEDTYEQILQECSNKVQGISDMDWADIVEKYGLNIHYDSLRKSQQLAPFGGSFVSEYYKWKYSKDNLQDNDEYLKQIQLEKQEIRKEKQKLFDERLDINRRLREESRLETTVEKIEKMLEDISSDRYEPVIPLEINSDNDIIVCLSDLHIGANFCNTDGIYNSDIAKERLDRYCNYIIKIQKTHNSQNCHIALLGDVISGNIHKSISVTNKEDVIQQVKLACEYVSDFVYELSKHFETVNVSSVSGNHSRLEDKEDALVGERLDTLVIWFIKKMLSGHSNIHIEDENIDDTLSIFVVRDNIYFGIHGDYDGIDAGSIAKLVLWAKITPDCILCGHKHHPAMSDVSGIRIVQSGSLCGSGDEYTRKKRLTGKPSQTVLVVNKNGIIAHYPVMLE